MLDDDADQDNGYDKPSRGAVYLAADVQLECGIKPVEC